jgi:hypothetical protein
MLALTLTVAVSAFPNPTITLNNGVVMPQLALGTFLFSICDILQVTQHHHVCF